MGTTAFIAIVGANSNHLEPVPTFSTADDEGSALVAPAGCIIHIDIFIAIRSIPESSHRSFLIARFSGQPLHCQSSVRRALYEASMHFHFHSLQESFRI